MIHILLADDHKLFRDVLMPLINAQPDMQVIGEAGSGREAIELCKRLQPDLILLDFGLPEGSGLQAMRAILADQPGTKVVFLTAFAQSSLLIEAMRHGAQGYITKSSSLAELLEFIRGVSRGETAISSHLMKQPITGNLLPIPQRKFN